MKITDLIPINDVTFSLVKLFAKKKGFPVDMLEENAEVINSALANLQNSGKYETLEDLLKDEELMSSLIDFVGNQAIETQQIGKNEVSSLEDIIHSDTVNWHMDNIITCPYCNKRTTLREVVTEKFLKEDE